MFRRGFPDGWSQPSPVFTRHWPFIKYFPHVWVKSRPALKKDIAALADFQHRSVSMAKYDKHSIVGKRDPAYTTERDIYLQGK